MQNHDMTIFRSNTTFEHIMKCIVLYMARIRKADPIMVDPAFHRHVHLSWVKSEAASGACSGNGRQLVGLLNRGLNSIIKRPWSVEERSSLVQLRSKK